MAPKGLVLAGSGGLGYFDIVSNESAHTQIGRPIGPHNIGSWPGHWASRRPNALALVDDERRLSWSDLETRVAGLAGSLRAAGVGPGERVAVLLRNRSAYLEILFGTTRIGGIFLPINLRLSPREIAYQLDDCRPDTLVYEFDLQASVDAALEHASHHPARLWIVGGSPDPYEERLNSADLVSEAVEVSTEDPAILMYTSGSTGLPKGALLPHRKALYNSLNAGRYFANGTADRVLVAAPLFHSLGLQILAVPILYSGGAVILQRRFEPETFWTAVDREEITYFGGVPTMHQRLEDALSEHPDRWHHSSLRFVFTAGSAVSIELIRAFEARGILLQQGYGQTETSILTCLAPEEAIRKAGSVGRPVHHGEVRVVDREAQPKEPSRWRQVKPGETGEIVVQGPITMLGYWEKPAATAQTFAGPWLCTGDLATRDAEGYITLVGRLGDMYISGGENVYPAEVEKIFREHPAIREIAVVGVPDPQWGEVGRAHVLLQPKSKTDGEELAAWARPRMAAFKVPRAYVFEKELPTTASGKTRKYLLRERG